MEYALPLTRPNVIKLLSEVAAVVVLVGCAGRPTDVPSEKMVIVGGVGGSDYIRHLHIERLLARHGIDAALQGSAMYSIYVDVAHRDRAYAILAEDSERRRRFVREPKRIRVNAWMSEALAQPRFGATTTFGRILRALPTLDDRLKQYSYICELEAIPEPYLGPDGEMHIGYYVTLTIATDSRGVQGTVHVQVWDDGRTVKKYGGGY